MNNNRIEKLINLGNQVEITINEKQAEKLIAYMDRLLEKNQHINLTRITEEDEFITEAAERFGIKGERDAKVVLSQAAAVFAGGELSDEDRLAFMTEIQQLYLESKDIAAKKFTPKKYRKDKE